MINTEATYFDLRVYHEDVDTQGIVYNANYLKYMERARTEWLVSMGWEQGALLKRNIGFVLSSAHLTFVRPARFYDALRVATRVVHQGKVSLKIAQVVQSQTEPEQVYCTGDIKIACVDMKTFKPCALPWQDKR